MALINWKAAVNGDWSNAADWSSGTVPTAADDVLFTVIGNYKVTITAAETANSLLFNAPGAQLVESAGGKLTLNTLVLDNGRIELDAANSIGSTEIDGGVVAVGNAAALGAGALTIAGGELLGTVNETLTNPLSLSGALTIAAAPGTTLDLGSAGWSFAPETTVDFGTPGDDGTVVWHTPAGSSGAPTAINIRAGTLKAGDASFSSLFSSALTSVGEFSGSEATLDLAGFSTAIFDLTGLGTITSSGGAATLTLNQGAFFGTISGALSLTITNSIELAGANTYTGNTTISAGALLVLEDGGSIALSSQIFDNGTFELLFNGGTVTFSNPISGTGKLVQAGLGTVTINTANNYSGGTEIDGGTLAVGNAFALGAGQITGGAFGSAIGKLLATVTETLTNPFATTGFPANAFTIAAAHGKALTMQGTAGWNLASGIALEFGDTGQDGTVVWFSPTGSANNGAAVVVNSGALKAGDGNLGALVGSGLPTVVNAGARLDLAGFSTTISNLQGNGIVTTSSGSPTIVIGNGVFGGTIAGAISLDIASLVLTGVNTYTGSTTIDSGGVLQLGAGGTTGSLAAGSAIADNGGLTIDRSNTLTLANAISGGGALTQQGTGTTRINTANTYSGGTNIFAGTLAIAVANALGSGTVTINGGELEGTGNISLPNTLTMNNSFTIAAAHGTTFTIGSVSWKLNEAAGQTVTIGAAGQDGTVLWLIPPGCVIANLGADVIDIATGTLTGDLTFLLVNSFATKVEAGAKLDIAGAATVVNRLQGAGTVTDSGAAAKLTLAGGGTFQGTLAGALLLDVQANTTLTGLSAFTGGTTLEANVIIQSSGTFDLTTDAGVAVNGSGTSFVNEAVFEKTGGGGTSVVSTPFTNNFKVVVTSGSVQFTGGFTNIGFVQGVLSQGVGSTTISANAAGQTTFFGGIAGNVIKVTKAPTYVDGGAGFDALEIASNMALAAGSLVSVERILIDNGITANLGALTDGEWIELLSSAGGGTTVGATQGGDTIIGGSGNDTVNGAAGNDRFRFSAANLSNADVVNGGAGSDMLVMTTAGVIAAGGVSAVETFQLADGAANSLTLANANFVGVVGAAITVLGGSAGNTVNAAALTGSNRIIAFGGAGADHFTGGAGNDGFRFTAANLTSVDTAVGGGGTDQLTMATAGAIAAGGISGVETFVLAGGGANSLTLTNANFTGVTNASIHVFGGAAGNTVNAAALTGSNKLVFTGGAGADTISLGAAPATVAGGGGSNRVTLAAPGSHTLSDFGASAGNMLVLRDAGFNLGADEGIGGASPLHLAAGVFVANATGSFTTTAQRFAYNTANGSLFYDPDGSGAGFAKSLVASLTDHATLSAGAAGNLFFAA